jgi:hypothetical protein
MEYARPAKVGTGFASGRASTEYARPAKVGTGFAPGGVSSE